MVGGVGGEEAGDDFGADDAAADEFECEDGTCDGGGEDGGEASGDAAEEEELFAVAGWRDEVLEGGGDARAHLDGSAFAACGGSEKVGAEGGDEDAGCEAAGDAVGVWIFG